MVTAHMLAVVISENQALVTRHKQPDAVCIDRCPETNSAKAIDLTKIK